MTLLENAGNEQHDQCDCVIHKSYTCHTHVIHILYTLHTHVIHMSYTCHTHVLHMSYTCLLHVIHMSYTCPIYVLHMSFTCHTRVLHMSYTCHTHDQCARFPIQTGMTAAATPHRSGPRPQRTYQTPGRGRMARFVAMSSCQWRSATAQPGNLSAWPRGWPKVRPGTTLVGLHLSSTNETL